MRTLVAAAITFWLSLEPAFAHGDEELMGGASWTFDPWIVTPLVIFGALYVVGTLVLGFRRRRSERGFGIVLYCGGWLSLAASLTSPMHWLGEHLFTFHMIEHEIIMAVSAPLLVLANPIGPTLWALPYRLRMVTGRAIRLSITIKIWRWLSDGRNSTVLHGIAIWAWHAPLLFDAAVTDVTLHRLQHLSFFLSAILFWWSVLRRSDAGAAAWHIFITMLHTSVLGALMALAPRVLYGTQTANAMAWGLTPLEDQQLAGVIMWIPAGTIYAGAALALMTIWIKHSGDRLRKSDASKTI